MKEADLKKIFAKNKNVVFHEEEDFGLLFDIETGRTHKINKKAVKLWKCINSKKPVAAVIDDVKKECGEQDTLPEDVWEFLLSLARLGLIEGDSGKGGKDSSSDV